MNYKDVRQALASGSWGVQEVDVILSKAHDRSIVRAVEGRRVRDTPSDRGRGRRLDFPHLCRVQIPLGESN